MKKTTYCYNRLRSKKYDNFTNTIFTAKSSLQLFRAPEYDIEKRDSKKLMNSNISQLKKSKLLKF
jgi:hypothetical protein